MLRRNAWRIGWLYSNTIYLFDSTRTWLGGIGSLKGRSSSIRPLGCRFSQWRPRFWPRWPRCVDRDKGHAELLRNSPCSQIWNRHIFYVTSCIIMHHYATCLVHFAATGVWSFVLSPRPGLKPVCSFFLAKIWPNPKTVVRCCQQMLEVPFLHTHTQTIIIDHI